MSLISTFLDKSRTCLLLIAFALPFTACGEDNDNDDSASGGSASNTQIISTKVPVNLTFVSTGIELGVGDVVTITSNAASLGEPFVRNTDPVPNYGHHGLIAKLGKDGRAFPVREFVQLAGSSVTKGKVLFIGRNDGDGGTLPNPYEYNPKTDKNVPGFDQISEYKPRVIPVRIELNKTNAPAPTSPMNGFYAEDPVPTFDWDDVDNVVQYSLEVSLFPDFRFLIFEQNNVGVSNLNFAALTVDATNPNGAAPTNALSVEGVYYWRIRAQVNKGRTLSPDFEWTDRSIAYAYGYDALNSAPPNPRFVAPEPLEVGTSLPNASSLTFSFMIPDHPGGALWRYRIFHSTCASVIDTESDTPAYVSPPRLFQNVIESPVANEPPQLVASFYTDSLSTGEYVYQVQTIDAGNVFESNISVGSNFPLRVNCSN